MIVFGSTGSIGINALKLAKKYDIKISALACGKNIKLLNEQIQIFKPKFVCVENKEDVDKVKHKCVFYSQDGLEKILKECEDKLLVNAIVGIAGLKSTLLANKLNKIIALANKESLVSGGKFLQNANIRPIDSEHSALAFLLKNQKNINKLFITASGGAFYKYKIKDLKNVNVKEALKHPNWSMGAKITIDSATMTNKLFEIIEAFYLFKIKNIDALIEPKSLIHAMCEFKDGGTTAYFSNPNMQLAISQAILNKNDKNIIQAIDFTKIPSLKFYKISKVKYPIFYLKDMILSNLDLGAFVNSANEVMVNKFLNNQCGFLDIYKGILKTLDYFSKYQIKDEEEIFEFDIRIREFLKA